MPETHSSRYAPLVASLARRAIDQAGDRAPHAPRPDEAVFPCARLLPLADRVLGGPGDDAAQALETLAEAAAAAAPRFTDGIGHSREVYHHLGVRLAATVNTATIHAAASADAPGGARCAALLERARAWSAARCGEPTGDAAVDLWRLAAAGDAIEPARRVAGVEAILDRGGQADSLQPQTAADSPDHWTFRELAGLHALAALVEAMPDAGPIERWRRRLAEIADFHQAHTQPDYTTYQPWALAVFARRPETSMFAEQQLHDVESHLNLQGAGGAVVPALLLADAAAML